MEVGKVLTTIRDPDKNFTFRVRASRKLTPYELKMAFAVWWRQRDRRRTYRNMVVEIWSQL